mmetsp:Transcript_18280/g.45476  ORF Transcript_18280/g.45476 Transcript_18280/m.45476 type:complete len:375 (-) Transcript_18280:972-2096(-)
MLRNEPLHREGVRVHHRHVHRRQRGRPVVPCQQLLLSRFDRPFEDATQGVVSSLSRLHLLVSQLIRPPCDQLHAHREFLDELLELRPAVGLRVRLNVLRRIHERHSPASLDGCFHLRQPLSESRPRQPTSLVQTTPVQLHVPGVRRPRIAEPHHGHHAPAQHLGVGVARVVGLVLPRQRVELQHIGVRHVVVLLVFILRVALYLLLLCVLTHLHQLPIGVGGFVGQRGECHLAPRLDLGQLEVLKDVRGQLGGGPGLVAGHLQQRRLAVHRGVVPVALGSAAVDVPEQLQHLRIRPAVGLILHACVAEDDDEVRAAGVLAAGLVEELAVRVRGGVHPRHQAAVRGGQGPHRLAHRRSVGCDRVSTRLGARDGLR